MRRLALLLTGFVLLAPAASAQRPLPCEALALVALPDQAETLGLAANQARAVDSLHTEHLRRAHELFGEIGALIEALHELERPFGSDEVFALLVDLAHHEAELHEVFREGAEAVQGVLLPDQRERWDALVQHAASMESPGLCSGAR
ncbi:MAG TPA: hypothetical protein EYQ24_01620 [Bacteroidetes bacterium]|nr:hypothetical protein [Bacteroidota bacterium]